MAEKVTGTRSRERVAGGPRQGLTLVVRTLVALALCVPAPAAAEKWDPIAPADFAEAVPPLDPTAGAEALFWKVWVEDEFENASVRSIRRNYLRVRIRTAEAAQEWSSREIRYPSHARVVDLQARTIQPDGTIADMEPRAIAKTVLVRYKGEKLKSVRFAPPNVRPGSIVEYRYREVYDDAVTHYGEFPLDMDIPARRIVYHLKPLQVPGLMQRQMSFRANFEPGKVSPDGYHLIEVTRVRAFRRERYMPPEKQVQSWMLLYYTDQKLGTPAKFWSEQAVENAKTFDRLAKPNPELRKTAESIVAGAASTEEKLHRIADWCRREIYVIRSTESESLRVHNLNIDSDARNTLAKRAAVPYHFDILFGALARAAGIEVRYVRVPSRRKIYFSQEMMDSRFVPSYQIAARVDGRWRCYDPQAAWLPWDMVPWDEEAQWALLCDPDSTMFVETPIAEPVRSRRVRRGELALEEGGDLAGTLRVTLTGHWNSDMRDALEDATDSLTAFRELMDWDQVAMDTQRLRILPEGDAHDSLTAMVDVRLRGHTTMAGSRILFEPSAWWARGGAAFASADRRWPVAFTHAWSDQDQLRIKIPNGWKVEDVTPPRPVQSAGVASYLVEIVAPGDGHVVEYNRSFDMGYGGSLYFPAASYNDIKKLFDMIFDRDRTTLSLVQEKTSP